MLSFLAQIGAAAADFVYPRTCYHCSDSVDGASILCPVCMDDIEEVDPVELREDLGELLDRSVLDDIFSMWMFDRFGPLSSLHRQLKYGNRPSIGVRLGETLGAAFASSQKTSDYSVAVPVPLHRTRFLERGYNQSERLSFGFCKVTGLALLSDAAKRHRPTKMQTGLSREQRTDNLDGAFICQPRSELTGKNVIVIDDILTTGATLESLATSLKAVDAGRVCAVALAFTRPAS